MSEFPISFDLEFPYTRTPGPVIGAYLTGLRDGRILGIRSGDRVLCPPMEFDPDTAETLAEDFVEVGPSGTVENWTWIAEPTSKHPFQEPFAFALVKLDGADTLMTHAVKATDTDAITTGMRVTAQYRDERAGAVTDVYFVPEADAVEQTLEAGEGPVEITTHLISLPYRDTLYPHSQRFAQGLLDGKFIGQRTADGSVSFPGKGYDPLARQLLSEADDVELPSVGTVLSYTTITPLQYHGQTQTEPYLSAVIILDGAGQTLTPQDIRNIPTEEFRVGMRLRVVFKPAEERNIDNVDNDWMYPSIGDVVDHWESTGEPDCPLDELPESM
jgi:uncharacterized OB-fold protein